MPASKIAITIDKNLVKKIDLLVREHVFPNRSKAIQEAVKEKLVKLDRSRLARECTKLDPGIEQSLADEGLAQEIGSWPEY